MTVREPSVLPFVRNPRTTLNVAAGLGFDVEQLARTCPTLRPTATKSLEIFARLHDSARITLHEGGREARLVLAPLVPNAYSSTFAETAITMIAQLARHLTGRELRATSVRFDHPRHGFAAELDAFFGCSVVFDAGRDEIAFPAIYLDLELPHPEGALASDDDAPVSGVERSASGLPSEPPVSQPPISAVSPVSQEGIFLPLLRGHMENELKRGDASLARVSSLMGLQPRTLQRRLHDVQTTYQDLLEEIRRGLALQYVGAGSSPLATVARELGFREASAFSRAFRRWTGATPRDYRTMARRRHVETTSYAVERTPRQW